MDLEEIMNRRRSTRSFKEKKVFKETIKNILEDANKAPSAGNLQARDFVVITEEDKKEELSKASLGQRFVSEAPVVIVLCANKKRSGDKYGEKAKKLYCIVDASLAAQNLMLSAAEKGLGTVYVGAFNEERVSDLINAPDYIKPIGLIPMGYSDKEPSKTSRPDIDELVHWGPF